jgi:hypothetical protein
MYCLCVNVYCTTATHCKPNCFWQIYHQHFNHQNPPLLGVSFGCVSYIFYINCQWNKIYCTSYTGYCHLPTKLSIHSFIHPVVHLSIQIYRLLPFTVQTIHPFLHSSCRPSVHTDAPFVYAYSFFDLHACCFVAVRKGTTAEKLVYMLACCLCSVYAGHWCNICLTHRYYIR